MQPIARSSGVKDGEESVTLYYSISSSRCLNLSITPRDSSVPRKTPSAHAAHYSQPHAVHYAAFVWTPGARVRACLCVCVSRRVFVGPTYD